ncbi:bacterial low temperature requirement A protein-domain-containing protein [Limtongia smithiae]|uniref:bacterial low temperature requirement A protein-domain-containing protein n=1 Tax=Limtongia smithiae TaxID=1125753 RepID=UPI0034CE205E
MSGAAEFETLEKKHNRSLFRQPLALQWIESGRVVKRSEEERQAGRFELFLDLLFVAILANFAEDLAEDVRGANLVKYILIFAPTWHIWSDLRELMNSFYNDDLTQRFLILWIMALLVMYANNATLVAEEIGAMRAAVGSYLAARASTNLMHLFYSFASYHHRPQQRLWCILSSICLCVYIPLFTESVSLRAKIAVAAIGISMEEICWVFCYSPAAKKMLKAKYVTAVDISHEVDRFAAFYIIVLGEYLYAIVVGSPAAVGFNLRLLRAVWTLIIAFCLNWLYVNNDGSEMCTHPMRHSVNAAFAWIVIHLPLAASLLAGGHVAAQSSTEDELSRAETWLLCGGIGTGVFCLYFLALLNKSEDAVGKFILSKPARLVVRPISAIIIILIPLAHSLEVTSVVSIIMALLVFCVLWESVTSLTHDGQIWEKWQNTDVQNSCYLG